MRCIFLCLLLLTSVILDSHAAETNPVSLRISDYEIYAEVANTHASRSQGLMFRESLEENNGMLFVFSWPGYYSMWMKNTYVPLSVAFIDENGIILNIADMIPQSEIVHSSSGKAMYALEMNMGWFSARKIAAGAQVDGLKKAPTAQ